MTTPVFYALILGTIIVIVLITFQNRKSKSITHTRKDYSFELNTLIKLELPKSNFGWSVFTRDFHGNKLVFESNDLGEAAYFIYEYFNAPLIEKKMFAYIKNNKEDRFLKILTDGSSESMIGVTHPTHGHIGYLAFEDMSNN